VPDVDPASARILAPNGGRVDVLGPLFWGEYDHGNGERVASFHESSTRQNRQFNREETIGCGTEPPGPHFRKQRLEPPQNWTLRGLVEAIGLHRSTITNTESGFYSKLGGCDILLADRLVPFASTIILTCVPLFGTLHRRDQEFR
jgi:hypothetical protein